MFTFNSKQRPLIWLLSALVSYCGLIALCIAVLPPSSPSRAALMTQVKLPESPDDYLGYSSGSIDQFALYYNFGHAADYARNADVLFLGNSKVKHAFRRESLQPFFKKHGLVFYNMAFGGEPSAFPKAIIEKFDLRPKWVVINADPFFRPNPSGSAAKVMDLGYWHSLKFRFEAYATFWVRHFFHMIVPYFHPEEWDWIEYRSYRDGTIKLVAYQGTPKTLVLPPPNPKFVLDAGIVAAALEFQKEIKSRGGKIVLTYIPPTLYQQALTIESSRALAQTLHVPLILPDMTGLNTIDGGHLNNESATRFSRDFLEQFERIIKK